MERSVEALIAAGNETEDRAMAADLNILYAGLQIAILDRTRTQRLAEFLPHAARFRELGMIADPEPRGEEVEIIQSLIKERITGVGYEWGGSLADDLSALEAGLEVAMLNRALAPDEEDEEL